ncbi:zinc finger and BTB domain-containing protein 12-like [Hemiscyllium ocellatum]|uniref:zinc finger and BTB domain-containing protein 12-like n=1 Tax=Hemiscyllium ocellatum TaxID=170820 RepID=UPI002966095B|nr:zinc finger and BTB domain-containing protein 12-like [Hemiscyllium ocellatum]
MAAVDSEPTEQQRAGEGEKGKSLGFRFREAMAPREVLQFQFHHHESTTLSRMNQLRAEERFCDVTVVTGQLRFAGHRVVLAACSPFLRDQFLLQPSPEVRVPLSEGAEMLSRLLLSCYTGSLDVPCGEVLSYLTVASYLQMDHVVEECRRALSTCIDPRIKLEDDRVTVGPRARAQEAPETTDDDDDVYLVIEVDGPAAEPSRSQPSDPRQEARPELSEAVEEEEDGSVLIGGRGSSSSSEDSSAAEESGAPRPAGPWAAPLGRPACPRPIHCSVCAQAFQHPEHLVAHMKAHKLFMCPRCGKVFHQRVNLARHVHVHTGIKPYLCTVCGRAFTQNRSLKDHMNLHSGARPHCCHYCHMSFAHKPALRRHLKEQHSKTTADNCRLALLLGRASTCAEPV